MIKPSKWCYAKDVSAEQYSGHFDTREEAVAAGFADLVDSYESTTDSIAVGLAVYPDPRTYLASILDIDGILGRMDEAANDDGCYSNDDEMFQFVGSKAEALLALNAALAPWAERHLEASYATVTNPETVRRSAEDER